MIKVIEDRFLLETENTSYLFRCLPSGHLEHLHYGKKIIISDDFRPLSKKIAYLPGNTIAYGKNCPTIGLENMALEMSSLGKGDIREPFIELQTSSGITTTDFLYDSHTITCSKQDYVGLPSSYGSDEEVTTLVITLKDRYSECTLELYYHVYYQTDVITRSAKLINTGTDALFLDRLMSTQLDFDHSAYKMTTFTGAWVREMQLNHQMIQAGTLVNSSRSGVSSNRANPFFMISAKNATETGGSCYGLNLVYSGNHYSAAQVDAFCKLRVVSGMNPMGMRHTLEAGDCFQSPECVMTFSDQGFGGMSRNMHQFIKDHIVRGVWQHKTRPVLINSWEAHYFDFNEAKLMRLAKKAKQIGIELFVLDDGWFGNRNDDTTSLGDWNVNNKKLPGGIEGLSKKITELGMDFGIWVEPEMVNKDSDLYRAHPEWAVEIPGFEHATGRNQYLLDLTCLDVQDYLIQSMSKVFSSGAITYVKWDMNRIFSDCHSQNLPAHRQSEFSHRYVLGLYRVLDALTKAFPDILFEGCASGGNRFDLGMLCYMPQIWASDNTDAVSRLSIQEGYSYGYPQSVIGAHVSDCPNHQTLRHVPLETRYHVASFGLLGYELNLSDLGSSVLNRLKQQITSYKKWRKIFQFGDFYRIENPTLPGGYNWMVVDEDQKKAVGAVFQKEAMANQMDLIFYARGLDPQTTYHFYNIPTKHNVKLFGDLINTASPVHIKNGSVVQHLVSKVYQLDGEHEDHYVSGSLAEFAGIKLKQGFGGVGFDASVRLFEDYASRLYYFDRAIGGNTNGTFKTDL
ncbi:MULTISPECIES: alpha-galactosidase [unclassified Fusibacter]|uniref:alpha-galactosidase n=1 Tax=unclassified Fusibacter TaxID=2624464 RepID=UPI0010116D41|nr:MULTISPECIES: alpha-galactosidase [unclassified Fusibacter]MCK8060086.1 alpha-galactosidase [Fusibacter sp. A2]NPE22228.1 alpha-galactosidase [Fusibacter sp. A1]RXV61002.1 alpha-galactosidase [Fusibacter sp. A1]